MNYREEVAKFLESQLIMHLGTSAAGSPSVCAVEFVHDSDFNFYWRSNFSALHSKNLLSAPHCAIAITELFPDNRGEGIQAHGTAILLTDKELVSSLAIRIDTKRNKVVSDDISKQEDERGYWKFTPTSLRYINEPVLGHDRVEIELP